MVRGFYQIGTGLFAQQKKLSTISNNIANAETSGYKKQTVVTESFEDIMLKRVQNVDNKKTVSDIGSKSTSRVVSIVASLHTQGSLLETERSLDCAIVGEGFFKLQSPTGPVYTRKGNFNIDGEGYLVLEGDRVMGKNGPIKPNTDNISFAANGDVYANGVMIDKLDIVTFDDYKTLTPLKDGFYTGSSPAISIDANVRGQTLEGSNVDMAQEVTSAIAAQRELQTQSQMLKMYDTTLQKATNLGKIN